MNKLTLSLVALLLLGAQGCQTNKQRGVGAPDADATVVLPFDEPEPPRRELDEDLVFSYLVGEIAAHRGELTLAQAHYQHAAILARDAYAAERATRIALHLKDYPTGLAAVRRWVELAPNDMTARQLAAVLLLRDGQADEAEQQLDALVKIADARGSDGFLLAASALGAEADRTGAEQLLVALQQRYPDDERALHGLAVLETAHRRFDQAEAHLRTVVERRPDWDQARVLLARVLNAQDRRDEALALLDRGVTRYRDSVLLRTTYARQLVDAGDYAGALKQFRALHALTPDDHEITFGFAMLATQQERWDEARPLWQRLRGSAERRDEASYYLAQIEESDGNDELAIGLYGTVGGDELKVDATMRMARLYARSGRLDDARQRLRQARIANPGRAADLYISETQLVQRHGDSDAALALYDTALAAFPDNHDLRYNYALYLIELGDADAMVRELERILAQEPDHADSLNALGYTLADRNERLDEAYGYIARAYRLEPDSAAILDSMGWVLYRQGDLDGAERYLRKALASSKDDEIAAHLGEVLWVSGRRDAARAVWRDALEHTPGSAKVRAAMQRLGADTE